MNEITVAHPDLSMYVYRLNTVNINSRVELIMNNVTTLLKDPNVKKTKEMREFLKYQLKIVEFLKLFPLRRLS